VDQGNLRHKQNNPCPFYREQQGEQPEKKVKKIDEAAQSAESFKVLRR